MRWTRWVAVGGVCSLAAVVGAWWWLSGPTYIPGALAARQDLQPPGDGLGAELRVAPYVVLHAFEDGEGPLTFVVHGGPGRPPDAPWPGLHALADHRRFLYVHQRGSGRSARPVDRPEGDGYWARMSGVEAALGLGQQLADIERVRRLAGVDRIALVGHSFGGFMTVLYAAEFPEHVAELVLVAPAAVLRTPSPEPDLFETLRARLPEAKRSDFDAFLARYLDFGPARFEHRDSDEAALHDELGAWYAQAVPNFSEHPAAATGGWMITAMYLSMGLRHDYAPALSAITAPTLVVHGSEDLQPRSVSESYARAIPDAELVVIEGAGHAPQVSHPRVFAEQLRSWSSLSRPVQTSLVP